MKLTKVVAAVLAAASLTSVSALAVNDDNYALPAAKDNVHAFIIAENFFNQGLYYEAAGMLEKVNPTHLYEAQKLAVWEAKVNEKIADWEISEIFAAVEKAYNANDVAKANALVQGVLAYALDADQAANYKVWNLKTAAITTAAQAIVAVENNYGKLWDPSLHYEVVKVPGGFDVYVKLNNSEANLVAYYVDADSYAVSYTATDWNGNPVTEFQF